MTRIWQQIKILLWKHFILRRRHFCLTFLDIGFPILVFGCYISYHLKIKYEELRYLQPKYAKMKSAEDIYKSFHSDIYYTPKTDFTSKVFEKIQSKLHVQNIWSFNDEQSLLQNFSCDYRKPIAVAFRNIHENKEPVHLDYVIMLCGHNWNLGDLFREQNGSKEYFEKNFIALQLALDTSYIETVSSKNLPVTISMEEFPYESIRCDIRKWKFLLGCGFPFTYGFLMTICMLWSNIAEEKSIGITELMKMAGLKSWMLWLGWFLNVFIPNLISIGGILCIIREEEYQFFEHCSTMLLVVFFLLYCASAITFCFAVSTFFYKPRMLILFGFLIWILSYHTTYLLLADEGHSLPDVVPTLIIKPYIEWSTNMLFALLPNFALYYGFHTIAIFEIRGVEISLTNMFESADGSGYDVTMGNVLVMFLFDIIFYLLITFYVGTIYPGPYGIGKSYIFPISYVIKKISKKNNRVQVEAEWATNTNPYCKIEPAPNLKPGIQLRSLYKKYGKATVVNDFSVDIYEQIITVLLGHNGAGKTTLLNLITGMSTATSGKVTMNGMDITKNSDETRKAMGFCTQHNLHFPDCTLVEHLQFFAMLRGASFQEANLEAEELLRHMNIYEKRNAFASQLSGGMKRRLSLGMALIGNPKVVILDEPTSGLDPELRREIWDFLIAMRGSRTIIITTHYMEEAEVLGDRVAIMDHGQLACYGTSMFLKREFGAGYHLTVTGFNNAQNVTNTVKGKIASAVLHSSSGNTLEYLLPHELKSQFSKLFEELESKQSSLGITSISISITTLEEVFLRVGGHQFKTDFSEQTDSSNPFFTADMPPKPTGSKLLGLQCWGLFIKCWYVMTQEWPTYLLMMTLLLLATLFELLRADNATLLKSNSGLSLVYNLNRYGTTGVYYEFHGSDSQLSKIKDGYLEIVKQQRGNPEMVNSVSRAIVRKAKKNIVYYSYFLIVAAQFDNSTNNINAMYSAKAYHGAAISLNLLMNAVLKGIMNETHSIRVESFLAGESKFRYGSSSIAWQVCFPFALMLLSTTFLTFPHIERKSDVKQLQFMCGVWPVMYWSILYLFDFIVFFISISIVIMFMLAYGIFNSTIFVGKQQLGALFIICLGYGLSIIPVMYLYSYAKSIGRAFAVILISTILSMIAAEVMMADVRSKRPIPNYHSIMSYYPPYSINQVLVQYNEKSGTIGKYCSSEFAEDKETWCTNIQPYFKEPKSIEEPFRALLISSLIYFVIILLLELPVLFKAWTMLIELLYKKLNLYDEMINDVENKEDIKDEMERISGILQQSDTSDDITAGDLFLAHEVEKIYGREKVVKGVSFAVKFGDCFGLLGVNGAGKTTVFRILTGDLPLTTGEARILTPTNDKVYLSKERKKFLENVGYCPQYDALNELLTGRQMLKVFALLRGVSKGADVVEKCITELGLKEFAEKPCGQYSGGNKRKLNVAMALIGRPQLVMFDEPTSGVDPLSRRKLWDVLNGLHRQDAKLGFILSSHSMDECEVLCTRLAIMKAGQLECCGTIPYLKIKFGQGFTVILKVNLFLYVTVERSLKDNEQATSVTTSTSDKEDKANIEEDPPQVKQVMLAFEQKYKGFCALKDKHPGMLHYHITDTTKKWSQLFSEIDELQKKYPVIEDYNISETTLEQIFLQIARSD